MTTFWDGRTDGRSDCTPRPAFAFGDAGKNYLYISVGLTDQYIVTSNVVLHSHFSGCFMYTGLNLTRKPVRCFC